MAGITDDALKAQVYLERLKAGYVRDWEPVQARLRDRIAELIGGLNVLNLSELNRRDIEKFLTKLRLNTAEITGPAMDQFLNRMGALATYSARLELDQLRKNLISPVRFAAPTAKQALNAALENPVQATGQMLEPLMKGFTPRVAAQISDIVRTGWAQGKTGPQMVRQLVGTKSAGFDNGDLSKVQRQASAVINTSTQHVATSARMATWEANSDIVDRYEWLSTLDRRTTTQCKSLDGMVFEAGKGPVPPIHVNCRSQIKAKLGEEWDFLDEGGERASSGPNPGDGRTGETYYEWLKRQPPEFQVTALGKERAALFQKGGLTPKRFAELNLGTDFKPLSLAEMKQLEPGAFEKAGL